MTTNEKIKVLDHGYVQLVEAWGSDERIIESARMSTQKGFEGWGGACSACHRTKEEVDNARAAHEPAGCDRDDVIYDDHLFREVGDEKLLKFLWDNRHHTPFEMGGLTIEVEAPIFIFREWHRHRTQSYNEASARFGPLPDKNYIPNVERLMMNAGTSNKQAGTVKDAAQLTEEMARVFQANLRNRYSDQEEEYQRALRAGVPKELARLVLPVGRYSKMRASANLRNWLAFLTLRSDKNLGAQWEIRQYANAVGEIVKDCFPRTHQLFEAS